MNKTSLLAAALLSSSPLLAASASAAEPVIVTCKFEKLPQMILIFRGGMGASDNTLQIGQTKPVPSRDDDVLIDAMVPLAKMLGYANALDVIASGRATYAMRVGHIPIYPFGQQQQYDWH
ncbi:hypothetical protein HFO86_22275 [Rhizobium leguminosarum]|uniref:hypothetical protein n=1 Tax=Rhizobium leguminosarum TaxID=384 RepID=UPI001C93B5E4|nr:hypothetical protein [Rhizobium leguminosarum]MBY5472932.1 hypothetical protein [Rhizobium leguminosarum]